MAGIKSAIFDLDGTILDSFGIWERVDVLFLERRGIEVPPDYIDELNRLPYDLTASYTKERFSLQSSTAEIYEEWNEIAEDEYSKVALKDGSLELLSALEERSVRMTVATDLPPRLYTKALSMPCLSRFFSSVSSSSEVGTRKSEPDLYLLSLRRLSAAPEETVLFEDLPAALGTGRKLGIRCVAIEEKATSSGIDELKKYTKFAYRTPREALARLDDILA